MISVIEHTASGFLKYSTCSSLKGLLTLGGVASLFSTGYFIQSQLVRSFRWFTLCTMPWMQRPLCLSVGQRTFSSRWKLHLQMLLNPCPPSPPPRRGRILDFSISRPCLLPINPCVWHRTVSAFCASHLTWFFETHEGTGYM